MDYPKGKFCIVPIEYLSGLDPTVQIIFCWMCKFADQDGRCFPSITKLMEKTGLKTKHTVIDKINILESLGLLIKTKGIKTSGKYTRNSYQIIIPESDKPGTLNAPGPGAIDDKNQVQNLHPNYTIDNYTNNTTNGDVISSQVNELIYIFKEHNKAVNYGHKGYRKILEEIIRKNGIEKSKNWIRLVMSIQGEKYAPVVNTPFDLKNKHLNIEGFLERRGKEYA